jgi:hypothetical protein
MPQGHAPEQLRRISMKAENKIPATTKSGDRRPAETKAVVVRAWAPQSNPLTREEIRKLVIDQIG